jgi:hypothetical protein
VCALAAALALPAAADANDFQTVYREFKRTGTVKPCRFSDNQLKNAQQQTPPDVEQYAPSFLDALAAARENGADCKKAGAAPAAAPASTPTPSTPTAAPAQPEPAATVPAATPPAPTVPVEATVTGVESPSVDGKRKDSAPAAVWLLAGLGALAGLAALVAAAAWWFGWSAERWTRPWRASISEFADRAATGRSEFMDWVRSGT